MRRWRRRHQRLLVRLWDRDFNLVGTVTDETKIEPWGRYARRVGRQLVRR